MGMRIDKTSAFSTKNGVVTALSKKKEPSFHGMTKQMKKLIHIDGQKDIKQIIAKRNGKSMIVGKLPPFIFNKLPKENREAAIREFYSVFDQISEELRHFDDSKATSIEELKKRRYKSTQKLLENLLYKYKLAGIFDDVDIEYINKGGKGAGYHIIGLRGQDIDEDELVMKNYHVVEGANWQPYKSHGNYAEQNSAVYWMNNAGYDTQRGKFFWGNLKQGYMIVKYIDEDVRNPERFVSPYSYGLKCTDEDIVTKHNTCKSYSYDWGGVRVINRVKNSSKTARAVLKKIRLCKEDYKPALWEQLYNTKKMDKSQRNAGLAMAIKHMPNKNYYINRCLELNDKLVNRALAYVLKYLPYEDSVKYFEKLAQKDDTITEIILFNEIPLIAKEHKNAVIYDDLQYAGSDIHPERILELYNIAEKYAGKDSIEHLASFLHLLPHEHFRSYYKRLAEIDNYALHDRLIYKLSFVNKEDLSFAIKNIASNLKESDIVLKKRLTLDASGIPDCDLEEVERLTGFKYETIKKEHEQGII